MRLARPYANTVRQVMSHLAQTQADHGIKLLEQHKSKQNVGFILITTDKGLCGGLNANVLKKFFAQVQEYQNQGVNVEIVCLGSKGLQACQRVGLNVIASVTNLGDAPKMETMLGAMTEIFSRYEQHKLDIIHLVSSRFVNTMKQEPRSEILLPLGEEVLGEDVGSKYSWDYIYEPSPVAVLEYLVRRYLESVVYEALSENMAAEQAARMVAMKAATDNAGNAIKELRLVYNKSRQAAITTELSEIVAGAAAV